MSHTPYHKGLRTWRFSSLNFTKPSPVLTFCSRRTPLSRSCFHQRKAMEQPIKTNCTVLQQHLNNTSCMYANEQCKTRPFVFSLMKMLCIGWRQAQESDWDVTLRLRKSVCHGSPFHAFHAFREPWSTSFLPPHESNKLNSYRIVWNGRSQFRTVLGGPSDFQPQHRGSWKHPALDFKRSQNKYKRL